MDRTALQGSLTAGGRILADEQKPNGHEYGGDEEFTPADVAPISVEARAVANIAVACSTIGSRLWDAARLLDSTSGDKRRLHIARLITELHEIKRALIETERGLLALSGRMP